MIKLINRILIFIFLSLILCITTIILDCSKSASSYAKLIPYIEKTLSDDKQTIKIEDITLKWDNELKSLNISVTNLSRIIPKEVGEEISAKIPKVNIELPLISFLPLSKSYKIITIDNPEINLSNNEQAGDSTMNWAFLNLNILVNNAILNLKTKDQTYSWHLNSDISWNSKEIRVNNLELKDQNHPILKILGIFNNKILDFSIEIDNLSLNNVMMLWPEYIKPEVKTWTVSSISSGVVTSGSAKFYIDRNNLQNNKISGSAITKDLTLHYYSSLPQIYNIDANISFNDKEIDILVSKAKLDHSDITKANVKIPYSLDSIIINGNAHGKISDLVAFIPDIQIASCKNYDIALEKITGRANTEVKNITIFLKETIDPKDILYDINSNLSQVNIHGSNIKDGALKLNFNGEILSLAGDIRFNNTLSNIKFQGFTKEDSEHDFTLNINSSLSADNIDTKLFGENIFKKGIINNNILVYNKNDITKANINADLTSSELKIDTLNFNKIAGNKLNFTANADISKNTINLRNAKLQGEDITITGDYIFSRKDYSLINAKLANIKFYKNNIALDYSSNANGSETKISGIMIDLSKADFNKIFDNQTVTNENKKTSINVSSILMKNNVIFTLAKGSFSCDKLEGYNRVYFDAKMNKNFNFNFSAIPDAKNTSKIIVDSDNGSLALQAFDIYKEINKGKLHVSAIQNNNSNPIKRNITGNLNIANFEATQTSIFSKLITITSVPGLLKLLSGGMIPFNNMDMKFDITPNNIVLSNGKIDGNQMSLSMEGNINTKNKKLDIKGLLIPDLFSLNRVVSAIPLLGRILKGSNKEGIIALNYTVSGDFDKPNIWANPLSLTPGIIKGLFGIFSRD